MNRSLDLALVGKPVAGKSVCGDRLEMVHGFYALTGSDLLHQEAARRGIVLRERTELAAMSRQLRLERGATFITDALFELPFQRRAHIGMRNRLDAENFLQHGGHIVALICPPEIRFARRDPNDPKHPKTLEKFIACEEAEDNQPDPYGIHTQWVMDQAEHTIDTSGSLAETYAQLDEIVRTYSSLHA